MQRAQRIQNPPEESASAGATAAAADPVCATAKGKPMSNYRPVNEPDARFLPGDVEEFDALAELALDMRWSWNHAAEAVWQQIDPTLWELTQSPWVILQTVSRDQLNHVFADPTFRKNVDDLLRVKR